jgi:hypothetical protein
LTEKRAGWPATFWTLPSWAPIVNDTNSPRSQS